MMLVKCRASPAVTHQRGQTLTIDTLSPFGSSSSRRVFYDPKDLRLLADKEIEQLSPTECDAACLQIDQILVSLLQNIDANFGRTHRTITQKILPEVERYGEASRGIWEGLKFWQRFFEASANVQLSGYTDELETGSDANELTVGEVGANDPEAGSPSGDERVEDDPLNPVQSIEPASNYEKFNPPAMETSHQSGSMASLRRPPGWNDMSFDSPDNTLQNPNAVDLSHILNHSHNISLASGISASPLIPKMDDEDSKLEGGSGSTRPRKSDGRGSILLHQAIMRNMVNQPQSRPNISTPMKPHGDRNDSKPTRLVLPPEVSEPGWNGIADLRKTTLDGFSSPVKHRPSDTSDKKGKSREWEDEDSIMAGIPPPQTIHFSIPRSKLARTPAKEAARLVTRDILETARFRAGYANPTDLEESPLPEPPSALREWKTRGYDAMFNHRVGLAGHQKASEDAERTQDSNASDENTIHLSTSHKDLTIDGRPSGSCNVSKSLIDFRDADTDRQSLKGVYDHLEDRDDHLPKRLLDDSSDDDRPESSAPKRISLSRSRERDPMGHDESYDEIGSPPNSPTLFGVGNRPSQIPRDGRSIDPNQAHLNRPATSMTQRGPSHQFVPMQPDQMNTFFGGDLLESECFEPSPLQGKRVKNLEPK